MKTHKRWYRVRYTKWNGERYFIKCNGYRDALSIQKWLGGKIMVSK